MNPKKTYAPALLAALLVIALGWITVAAPSPAAASDFLPYGWGSNGSGQLTTRDAQAAPTPVKLRQPSEMGSQATIGIAAGARHACSMTATGEIACCGQAGQEPSATAAPQRVAGLGVSVGLPVLSAAAGGSHSCAVTAEGKLFCWGRNHSGQLGDGSDVDRPSPAPVSGALAEQAIAAVALGDNHTCAITDAGEVWCWGANGQGQLGNGTTVAASEPQRVSGFPEGVVAVSVAAGGNQTCATGSEGLAYCWGANHSGQAGGGDTPRALTPTPVALPEGAGAATETAVGKAHVCARTDSGGVYCWGRNNAGQLGDGTTNDSPSAVVAGGGLAGVPVLSLSAGGAHTCATGVNTETYCWGANGSGQIGDGTSENKVVPTQVQTAAQSEKETRPAASVATGGDFTLGIYAYAAKPGVPRDVQINGTTLTWQPPLYSGVGAEAVSQYRISYTPEGQAKPAVFATLPGTGTSVDLGAGCPQYAVCPLKGGPVEPGKTYRWTVAAVGLSGAASSNARTATAVWEGPFLAQPPKTAVAPPSMPIVNGLFGTSLSWQPPGYFGELGSNLAQYSIRIRPLGEKSFAEYAALPADQTSFDLAGTCPVGAVCPKKTGELVPGVIYEVWVYAVGADGALSKVPRGGQPYSFVWG